MEAKEEVVPIQEGEATCEVVPIQEKQEQSTQLLMLIDTPDAKLARLEGDYEVVIHAEPCPEARAKMEERVVHPEAEARFQEGTITKLGWSDEGIN